MADYTFFFNPMSRSQIARWALHEVGADYDPVLVDWADKPKALLAANPLGKIPTIIHHASDGDRPVSEGAAVCHYLAVAENSDLQPRGAEIAPYFRWMFFAAGPAEAAITAKSFGFDPEDARAQGSAGWGSLDRVVNTLETWFAEHAFVCGDRFTMADVYVGSMIGYGSQFGAFPERAALKAYVERAQDRDAYREASGIDGRMIAEMQAAEA